MSFDTEAGKLPDEPSALLRAALADLKKVEEDPGYVVFMGGWHRPANRRFRSVCEVCLAGATMAKTLGVPSRLEVCPEDFTDRKLERKLRALNFLRVGKIALALRVLGHGDGPPRGMKTKLRDRNFQIYSSPGGEDLCVYMPSYHISGPECFHEAVGLLADALEECGL